MLSARTCTRGKTAAESAIPTRPIFSSVDGTTPHCRFDESDSLRDVDDDVPVPGGNLEYAVLVALWNAGELTARQLHERVGERLGLVYTTTTKVLERLHLKGLVERSRQEKVFLYRACAARPAVDRARMSKTLGGLFADEPRPALASLVEAIESMDPALLDELALAVDARRRSRR